MNVTVIGAGHVGATVSQRVSDNDLAAEVVFVDFLVVIPL